MNSRSAKRRIVGVFIAFWLLFTGFGFRLIQIQLWEHEKYVAIARGAHSTRIPIPAQRGAIRDVRGEILATNRPLKRVIVDGTRLTFPRPAGVKASKNPTAAEQQEMAAQAAERLVALVTGPLDLDDKERLETLERVRDSVPVKVIENGTENVIRPGRPYLVIGKKISEESSAQIRAILEAEKIKGVYFEPDSERIYPNGSLLSHVVGFLDSEGVGVQGIEKTLEKNLLGQAGYRQIERDRFGNELAQYRGIEQDARDGDDVVLTVDTALQAIVERELDEAVKKYKPDMATVVMMRPSTGEILAMASRPDFDPNDFHAAEPEQMKNRAVLDMVEPGSTFKIVAVAAALNEKRVKPDTTVFCENGRWEYGGSLLHDAHPYGVLKVNDIIVHSSNIGAAKLAIQLGSRPFYQYIKQFGFGDRTGIELPGEIGGIVHPVERWSAISISRIPMGHEVGVTPLQLTNAMCTIANGGRLMMPRLVNSVIDSRTGQPSMISQPVEIRRVISEETARQMRNALEGVAAPGGTAKQAAVKGYRVGGKTGTAQKVDPKNGGYLHGKYIVSFVGFLPAENPEIVCLVLLDNAQAKPNENFGGQVAGPVFSRIAEQAAKYLGIEPSGAPISAPAKLAVGNSRD
jgi:cell division protein FtsI/penicillin-binding protein 2